jgi:Protein of unknown function (DUF3108)
VEVSILLRKLAISSAAFLLSLGLLGAGPAALQQNSAQKSEAPAALPPLPAPAPGYRLPTGQTLVYGAEWRVFHAGIVTLRIERAGQEARVLGTADAIGSVAVLYHGHDTFESFLDPSTFCSRNITKHTEEGLRRVDTSITFDYEHHRAVTEQKNLKKNEFRHEEHAIPGCVTDVISAIYYASSLPLQPGKTISFPMNDGGNTIAVDLHVEAREQIKTPAGTFNTIRVHPENSSPLLKQKGRIWVWYTDDAAHIPVQMRGHLFWGTVTLTLQRIEHN